MDQFSESGGAEAGGTNLGVCPLLPLEDADDYEALPSTYSAKTHMTAGAIAGIMEHCVMYPLDSVKTRMQSINPDPKASYKTVTEALYKMVRYEGVLRPVRGVSVMMAGAGPAHALYFSCYEKMKRVISGTENGARNPFAQGAAGCLATLLHDAVMNPAEVVKQRLQMYNSPYKNVVSCGTDIWRKEGLRAFYRSYTTALTINVPFQSIHFILYEYMQEKTNPSRAYNPKAHMASGAVAGAFASAVTTPLDVCKTLLNTQESHALSLSKQPQITGLFNAASTIYKCCGPKGYFQGLKARVMYTIPSTAISWSVYEFFKYFISSRNSSHSVNAAAVYYNPSEPVSAVSKWETTTSSVVTHHVNKT